MKSAVLNLILLPFQVQCFVGKKDLENGENFHQLYTQGQDAYLENNFELCVSKMEAALNDYKLYTDIITGCKFECQSKSQSSEQNVVQHLQEMMPFEKLIRETLCLMKCKEKNFPRSRDEFASEATRVEFEKKKPYDYLQLCYFKTDQLQKAANAAYTNYIYNIDNQIMKNNLDYYKDHAEVDKTNIVDLEEQEYVRSYFQGLDFYEKGQWQGVVTTMEKALRQYLAAEEKCRINCDKPFDMGWYPDFKSSVANHFTFCLKCQMNCAQLLNNFRGESLDNLVPTFYHYLQYGHYQLGNLEQAAQYAWTYLYMVPESREMKDNVQFYKDRDVDEIWFSPRPAAVNYVHRDNDEEALLTFIEEKFIFSKAPSQSTLGEQEEFTSEKNEEVKKNISSEKQNINKKLVSNESNELQPPPITRFSW